MNDYGAVQLDGSTQSATASSADHINFGTEDFAIDVAFIVTAGSGIRVLLGKWVSSIGWRVQVNISGDLQFLFNGLTYTVSTTVDDGDWHYLHVSVDRVGARAYIFIDGALDGTLLITGEVSVSNIASLELGWDGSGNYWNGKVSEVRLSDRTRTLKAFVQDIRQFVDDNWTQALYHFNEGQTGSTTFYDMSTGDQNNSHSRNNMTQANNPVYIEGPYEANVLTIVRESVWLALDSYANLTTFLSVRGGHKFRYRPSDKIVSQFTAVDTPAIVVIPTALPDIQAETSAFHAVFLPIEIQGKIHHKDVSEAEFFWWLIIRALFSMYTATSTAAKFNFARIQHMRSLGPDFVVQEQQDESLFSEFTDTFTFEIRHDFFSG